MLTGEKKKQELDNPLGVPTTFKHLDLTWKPILRVQLFKAEPGGDHAPTKFSISEMQGKKQGSSTIYLNTFDEVINADVINSRNVKFFL